MASETPKAAFLIIDMQEDFCEPNGSLATKGGRELSTCINQLLDLPGWTLKIATRDYHPRGHISFASAHDGATAFVSQTTIANPENASEVQTTTLWPDHCVQGTAGCEIIPEIDQHRVHKIIDKGTDGRFESYSGFGPPFRTPQIGMTELGPALTAAGITHVFSVGLAYNICVFHTAIDAAKFGYKSFVISEGTTCKDTSEENLASIRRDLGGKQVSVISMDSPELDIVRAPR